MFFTNSMIIFFLFCVGREKFSPSCIKQWTSCGIIVDVKLISQLSFLENKDDEDMLSMKSVGFMVTSFGCEEYGGRPKELLLLVMLVIFGNLFCVECQ